MGLALITDSSKAEAGEVVIQACWLAKALLDSAKAKVTFMVANACKEAELIIKQAKAEAEAIGHAALPEQQCHDNNMQNTEEEDTSPADNADAMPDIRGNGIATKTQAMPMVTNVISEQGPHNDIEMCIDMEGEMPVVKVVPPTPHTSQAIQTPTTVTALVPMHMPVTLEVSTADNILPISSLPPIAVTEDDAIQKVNAEGTSTIPTVLDGMSVETLQAPQKACQWSQTPSLALGTHHSGRLNSNDAA